MSSLYDTEMIRRLMAPPEGAEPPGVAKGSRRQQLQQRQMPPAPQAGATYGGGEALPPLPLMIQQANDAEKVQRQQLGQVFRDTAPGVSPAESRLQELAGGLQPLRGMSGPTPTWSPPGSSYFVPGEPPDYKYLADSAKYARDEQGKQDERTAAVMANRNQGPLLQALSHLAATQVTANADSSWNKMKDAIAIERAKQHLAGRPGDIEGAFRESNNTRAQLDESIHRGNPGAAMGAVPGGPPPAPPGEFQPSGRESPLGVASTMDKYGVFKKSAENPNVFTGIDPKKLVEMLYAEKAMQGQYGEVARQLLSSGVPEGDVIMPLQRQFITGHNTATGNAPEGTYGPFTIKKTTTPYTPPEPGIGDVGSGYGGGTTGYSINGPGLDGGGIWHGRSGVFTDNMASPFFPSDKARADAAQQTPMMAELLKAILAAKAATRQASPPPGAVPPR